MTFHNLKGNWIDRLSRQYTQDLLDKSPHPIKYLLWNPTKAHDIFYLIPSEIDPSILRKLLVKYYLATKGTPILEWGNHYIKVWPHPHDPNTRLTWIPYSKSAAGTSVIEWELRYNKPKTMCD